MTAQQRSLAQEEVKAIEASLRDVGAVVAEMEAGRPLSAWSRDEILRLIFTTVRAYQQHMGEITEREGAPF